MYAVIQTGGKQYRVSEGLKLKVEKLDAAEGDSIELDKVLMVANGDDVKIGAPYIDGGKVTATVTAQGRIAAIQHPGRPNLDPIPAVGNEPQQEILVVAA